MVASPSIHVIETPVTGNELVQVDNGTANIVWLAVSQLVNGALYSIQVPGAAFAITVPNNIGRLILEPTGAETGTITLPAAPSDGQIVQIFTTQTLTLTLSVVSGQTIVGGVTTLAANASVAYIFDAATSAWHRSQ